MLARSLVIQESKILDLGRSFGTYEMAITPGSIFCNDGTLLTPNKKSSLTDLIEALPTSQSENKMESEPTDMVHIQNCFYRYLLELKRHVMIVP